MLNPDIMLWKLKADAERERAEAAEDNRDVLTYKLEQCQRSQDMIVRRAEAAEKRVRDIWDWWYGEKRGHATPEEFDAFLEAKP